MNKQLLFNRQQTLKMRDDSKMGRLTLRAGNVDLGSSLRLMPSNLTMRMTTTN